MPTATARSAKSERDTSAQFHNVSCPFCGLLCDDLEIERKGQALKVQNTNCVRAVAGFERPLVDSKPMLGGKPVDVAKAISAAADLIGKAQNPLFGGLATDVEGMRAVMALAERAGGIVDHALSEAQFRNFKVLQATGWVTSTLTETRNRADLIIVVGDVLKFNPRFFERIVNPPHSMFHLEPPKRTVVFLGKGLDASVVGGERVGEVVSIPCPIDRVGEFLGAVRARLRGFPVQKLDIEGVSLEDVEALATRCREAKYGVIAWPPPGIDIPHGETTVQQIADLARDNNQTSRFTGLPLAGNEGAVTAGAVCAWQSGYPLRTGYASGAPDFDPYRHSIGRMLAAGEGDLLVWISSFTPDLKPPKSDIPIILIATPSMVLDKPPAVFIPVGTPGLDHTGRIIRCDNVVALPLKNLGRSDLPRAADVLASIEAAL